MNLFNTKKTKYIFIALLYFPNVFSASYIQRQVDDCSPGGGASGPVVCTWEVVEEFGFSDSSAAEEACNDWLDNKPNDTQANCTQAITENVWVAGWLVSPLCNAQSCPEKHHWLAGFYFDTCPPGVTVLDSLLGCVQEDEPQECEYQAGNPINTAVGTKYHAETINPDMELLSVELNYTSNFLIDRFGNINSPGITIGWSYDFNRTISPIFFTTDNQTFVYHKSKEGRRIRFNKTNGSWNPALKTDKGMILTETVDGWQLKTNEGVETYKRQTDGNSLIESFTNHDGRTLTFSGAGYVPDIVKNVSDEYGNYVRFYFNGWKMSQIYYSDGRTWSFDYDTNGNLKEINYPDNTIKEFHYEDPNHLHALTGITSRHPVGQTGNRFATYQYDADRRVIKEWHHAKDLQGNDIKVEELDIVYNADNTRTITNSRGEVSTYEVEQNNGLWQIKSITGPGCSSCSNDNTDFEYDTTNNNLISKTQDGVTTKYFNYDSKGQYAYKIEAFGTVDARRTDYTYDLRFIGKITSITEPSVYGSNNKVTSYTYNDNGQMTAMTESGFKPDGTAISRTTVYEYNGPFNQISRIDDPRVGTVDETVYEYYNDTVTPETNRNRLKQATGPEGILERSNIQWSSTGKVTEEQRPNGITITNVYDPNNDRLTTSTQSDGVKSIVTGFTYLATGHIESVTRNHGTAEASTLTLTYDDALRVTRVTDQLGNYVEYELDTEGNQLGERTYDPNDVLMKQIVQTFDAYDMLETMTQSGVTMDYDYGSNGSLNDQTNGNNIITDYSYDNLKRLTQINQDYQGTNPATANTTTGFTYDDGERVETVTDARGNITTYSYDDFGNLITLQSPDTGTTSYTYDEAGNMTSKTDANGVTSTMSYDDRGRITHINYPGLLLDNTFVYDQGVNSIGMLSSFKTGSSNPQGQDASSKAGDTVLSYDGFGNLTNKSQELFNQNLVSGYQYDSHNRLQNMTYPSGLELVYVYDDLNQVQAIKHKPFSLIGLDKLIVSQVDYLPFGPVIGYQYINGLNYNANYDDGYRLNDYGYSSINNPSIVTATYGYDNNHNITSITREVPALYRSYVYDNLDRITDDGDQAFGYDKLGNRTSETPVGQTVIDYIYANNSNLLESIDSLNPTRSYDNNGNTLTISDNGNQTFTYSDANRIGSFSDGSTATHYEYNAIGQRVLKWQSVSTNDYTGTSFMYDEQGQLINETNFRYNQGTYTLYWMRETVWLGNRPIAQLHSKPGKSGFVRTWYYIMADHLNTPRWVSDGSGDILWSWESDAFGTTLPNEDVDGDGKALEFNLRFPGQYFDGESDLHYNYFRDYEPGTGRYVQSDPIGLLGGVNTYSYVYQNVINYTDKKGLGRDKPGPWHPPNNVKTKCRPSDDCATLNAKIWVLEKMIHSHSGWDRKVPAPRGGSRHKIEIDQLWRQLSECQYYKFANCVGLNCGERCKKTIQTIGQIGAGIVLFCGSLLGFGS